MRNRPLSAACRESASIIAKTLVFTVLVPGSVAVLIPYLIISYGWGLHFAIGDYRFFGLLPMSAGGAVYLSCASEFAFAGEGTPAPTDPPRRLVSNRLYRLCRNPMYVGVLTVLVGEAIMFASATLFAYAAAVWLLFHIFVVYYEEPHLREKFGASYEDYCRAVPRWLPRLKRRAPESRST